MASRPRPQRVSELLQYDEATGVLSWRKDAHDKATVAGKPWGCVNRYGYVVGRVDYKQCCAHQLVWVLKTGEWPEQGIDHVDGVRSNNRWANLRYATVKQNAENRRPHKGNSSGRIGVCYFKGKNKYPWMAHICHNDRRQHLGNFPTLVDAVAARMAAERALFTHAKSCGGVVNG